jgi:deazaflavin-dependent oxidoreductase (nitroreductase family)
MTSPDFTPDPPVASSPAAPSIIRPPGRIVRALWAIHTALYRLTGGLIGGRLGAYRILLLTTTGRRTGRARTLPLTYLAEGDTFIIIASFGGSPRPPAWYLNLLEHPQVQVQVKQTTRIMTAVTATPQERARLWPRLIAQHPVYAEYQGRTTREIPLVILHPLP